MESEYSSYEDLYIWQESMRLCHEVYQALEKCRDYGLRDQMQRSCVSIPSNIAEGFELGSHRGFIRHLFISKGSSGELRTQLYIALKRGYIEDEKGAELIELAKKVSSMIYNFIKERRKWLLQSIKQFFFQFIPICLLAV